MAKENGKKKVFKLKRVFVNAIATALRNTAPKDFPTTGELKETIGVILPALKEHTAVYADMQTRAEALALKHSNKEISEEDLKKDLDEVNAEWKEYNKLHGTEIVEVKLSEEAFKTFRTQFERDGWGAKWLANLDEYAELMEAFTATGK